MAGLGALGAQRLYLDMTKEAAEASTQEAAQETARLEQRNEELSQSMRRRTRTALQPQSNLFSILGQRQGRDTLG